MKILIVEDEFTSRAILEKILSSYGVDHQCVNGREVFEAFTSAHARGEPFDLVCLDVIMPEMDGSEALVMIRAAEEEQGIPRDQGVKVVMTTGHYGSEDDLEPVKSLSDAVISKPVRLQDLTWTLTNLGLI